MPPNPAAQALSHKVRLEDRLYATISSRHDLDYLRNQVTGDASLPLRRLVQPWRIAIGMPVHDHDVGVMQQTVHGR